MANITLLSTRFSNFPGDFMRVLEFGEEVVSGLGFPAETCS